MYVLSFDKRSIAYERCYDKGTDMLYDSKKKVQYVMIRRMVNSWRQLVYYNFDCHVSEEILFELILKLEVAGFPIVAMINGLCITNVKLWNSLFVGTENSTFADPAAADGQICFCRCSSPHQTDQK